MTTMVSKAFAEATAKHPKNRSIQLVYLIFSFYTKLPNRLNILKNYWKSMYKIGSCFKDLRPMIGYLSREERQDFHTFIMEKATSLKPSKEKAPKV
jgi:hypothetical protein